MNYIQHRNYGLLSALTTGLFYFIFITSNHYFQTGNIAYSNSLLVYSVILFLITFGGSLAPDLDISSTPSRYVGILLSVYIGTVLISSTIMDYLEIEYVLNWEPPLIMAFIFTLCKSTTHRGITHAWFWPPVLIGLSIYTGNHGIGAFAVGLATHYLCDSISPFRIENWV